MHFYPAIDIKDGQFIRLKKGQLDQLTIYGDDPVKQAKNSMKRVLNGFILLTLTVLLTV